jgi:hypothetical protein
MLFAVDAASYFLTLGDGTFRATEYTSGAWSVSEQHISPMVGLITHEVERALQDDAKSVARLSVDILGVIAVGDFEMAVRVVRPGRTIALVEAQTTQAGRTVALARAWCLAEHDTSSIAGSEIDDMPGPDELPPWDMTSVWPGDYIGSLEVRRLPDAEPGRAIAWVRTPIDLLAGEAVSPLAKWIALVDTANGISVRSSPQQWQFPNVDLTIHLHREPRDPWVGFDSRVTFGASGLGVTSTVLYDIHGPVGHAEQMLTVRKATAPG